MPKPTIQEMQNAEYADLIVRVGNMEKLKRGKIISVEREAASLRFEDGTERKFRFDMLRPVAPPVRLPLTSEPEPPKTVRQPEQQMVRIAPIPSDQADAPRLNNPRNGHSEALPPKPDAIADIEAYLQMGREMQAKIKDALDAIPARREALQEEINQLNVLERELLGRMSQLGGATAVTRDGRVLPANLVPNSGGPGAHGGKGAYAGRYPEGKMGAHDRNERAVSMANGFLSCRQLAQNVGGKVNAVTAALNRACAEGRLIRVQRGIYDQAKKRKS